MIQMIVLAGTNLRLHDPRDPQILKGSGYQGVWPLGIRLVYVAITYFRYVTPPGYFVELQY